MTVVQEDSLPAPSIIMDFNLLEPQLHKHCLNYSVAVIRHHHQKQLILVKKMFISPYNLKSIIQESQGKNST